MKDYKRDLKYTALFQLSNKQDFSINFESVQMLANYKDNTKSYLCEAIEVISTGEKCCNDRVDAPIHYRCHSMIKLTFNEARETVQEYTPIQAHLG